MIAFKCGNCVDPSWASTQPLHELLVAAGFRRRRLPLLAARRALGLAWSPQDLQAGLQCDGAVKELKGRDLLVWQPLTPLDLVLKSSYTAGVLAIRYRDQITLLRLHTLPSKGTDL